MPEELPQQNAAASEPGPAVSSVHPSYPGDLVAPEQPLTEQGSRRVPTRTPAGYEQFPYPSSRGLDSKDGLRDTTAGALAYVTIIPAILFLVIEPYNMRPFVKFHAFQCLGLFVVEFCVGLVAAIPLLGSLLWLMASLTVMVVWVLSLIKASQGSFLRLPLISEFASEQSGYAIAAR